MLVRGKQSSLLDPFVSFSKLRIKMKCCEYDSTTFSITTLSIIVNIMRHSA
jgi:hypothetical protein